MLDQARNAEAIFREAIEVQRGLPAISSQVDVAAARIVECFRQGGKVMFCGNGGSASDAQHLAAEFLGRFLIERRPLPSIALTSNSSTVTAISNDTSYDCVFSRQVRGLGHKGDILVGISTSGRSRNVVEALRAAGELGIYSISLTGDSGNKVADHADLPIRAPSDSTPRIQEMHITIGHAICEIVENALCGDPPAAGENRG